MTEVDARTFDEYEAAGFVQASATALPFAACSFDAAVGNLLEIASGRKPG
jgi:hypothetical protein